MSEKHSPRSPVNYTELGFSSVSEGVFDVSSFRISIFNNRNRQRKQRKFLWTYQRPPRQKTLCHPTTTDSRCMGLLINWTATITLHSERIPAGHCSHIVLLKRALFSIPKLHCICLLHTLHLISPFFRFSTSTYLYSGLCFVTFCPPGIYF